MSAPLLDLLAQARRAGLLIERKPDGQLVIRGPRSALLLVRSLQARKTDLPAIFAAYSGTSLGLDWRRERILDNPAPCAMCGKPTLLIEPYDRRPCHKGCAEAAIRWGTAPGVRREPAA